MYRQVQGHCRCCVAPLCVLCVLYVLTAATARAGEGTLTQLADVGLEPTQVQAVCITHHHGDHCFGLPALVQARHELQLEREYVSPCLHCVCCKSAALRLHMHERSSCAHSTSECSIASTRNVSAAPFSMSAAHSKIWWRGATLPLAFDV